MERKAPQKNCEVMLYNVEHTAFLTKRETAKKYTRQVRQYINEQQMKREREKSRQRTQAKHRNKNTLE